jgi:hypothetical protein
MFGLTRTRIPQFVCALLAVAVIAGSAWSPVSAQEGGETAAAGEFDPASRILSLEHDGYSFYLVRHGERFSIFAEAVPAHAIFKAMEPLGGPAYDHANELTRPVTLTMHDVTIERLVRKMLDGHSFTYRYSDGRLSLVSVLPLNEGRMYKTPPAVESRSRWTEVELDLIASREPEDAGSQPATEDGQPVP